MIYLERFGQFLPTDIITSDALEETIKPLYDRFRLSPGRLEHFTGVRERRHFHREMLPSAIATRAAEIALGDEPREGIDLLINASVTRDVLEPATAAFVHEALKLSPHCPYFDISNACLGVLSAIHLADQLPYQRVLVVAGENGRTLLESTLKRCAERDVTKQELKKLYANFTIGSSGVALLLTKEKGQRSLGHFSHFSFMADTTAAPLCRGDVGLDGLLTMETDSEQLLLKGLALAQAHLAQKNVEDLEAVITHQVGVHHDYQLRSSLNLLHKPTVQTFPTLGNTGPCALPLTLALGLNETKHTSFLCLGIGSGLGSLFGEFHR